MIFVLKKVVTFPGVKRWRKTAVADMITVEKAVMFPRKFCQLIPALLHSNRTSNFPLVNKIIKTVRQLDTLFKHLKKILHGCWKPVKHIHHIPTESRSDKHVCVCVCILNTHFLFILDKPRWHFVLLHETWFSVWVFGIITTTFNIHFL